MYLYIILDSKYAFEPFIIVVRTSLKLEKKLDFNAKDNGYTTFMSYLFTSLHEFNTCLSFWECTCTLLAKIASREGANQR